MKSNQFAHRIPDTEFWVEKSQETAADNIYLGLFLALCLFVAVLFGNLLFTVMVVILSIFIMLSYSSSLDRAKCKIDRQGIFYEKSFYPWDDLRYFDIVENVLDNKKEYLRLSFNNYLNPHVYIPIPINVQRETLYVIMSAHLEESSNAKLSLAEMLMLRFFKW